MITVVAVIASETEMLGHSSGCRENARVPGCLDLGPLPGLGGPTLPLSLPSAPLASQVASAAVLGSSVSNYTFRMVSCFNFLPRHQCRYYTPCSQILGQAPTSLPCPHSLRGSRSVGRAVCQAGLVDLGRRRGGQGGHRMDKGVGSQC